MTDRASWLPSDEEIRNAYYDDIEEDGWPHMLRLFEIAVLKGQIEALESWYDSDADDEIAAHLDRLGARLSELEGSHE